MTGKRTVQLAAGTFAATVVAVALLELSTQHTNYAKAETFGVGAASDGIAAVGTPTPITPTAPVPAASTPPASTPPAPAPGSAGRIYLTFDDGPSKYTTQILDILRQNHSHATFFIIGRQVSTFPDTIRTMKEDGNAIGLHSWAHTSYKKLSYGQIREDIVATKDAIQAAGGNPGLCLRPPYGDMNQNSWTSIGDTGYHVIMWDVDTADWKGIPTENIIGKILAHPQPDRIVLMHDGGGVREKTVEAVRQVVPELIKRGYSVEAYPACLPG